jgi:hypothetical protein
MSYLTVSHCGTEHQEWLKAIDFYDNEIDILENRLSEIAKKNTSHEAMEGVEHFQNQFIIQRNNIDELRHNINEHAHKTKLDAEKHAGHVEEILAEEHTKMKDEFTVFEKVVNELRQEFNEYLTKWM